MTEDHDLLIRIDEKVSTLYNLLMTKADTREVDDLRSVQLRHGIRIAKVERWIWIAIGALIVIQILLSKVQWPNLS